MFRGEQYFEDFYKTDIPIVNQIEEWSKKNNIILQDGWKVELSRNLQNRIDKAFENINEEYEKIWVALFDQLLKGE